MKLIKQRVLADIIILDGATVVTSCSDDHDDAVSQFHDWTIPTLS